MANEYTNNLIKTVIDNSEADVLETAVAEWDISWFSENKQCNGKCLCGKENIRYEFEITNHKNGYTLKPIGSSCIKKFNREDLSEQVDIIEQMYRLFHEFESNKTVSLKSGFFSKKLLKYLYNEGAFDTDYNNHDGKKDFEFIIDMFNKRSEPTSKQQAKIDITLRNIQSFLSMKLYLEQVSKNNGTFCLLVAGTRTYQNYKELEGVLNYVLSVVKQQGMDIEIVSGGATGADTLAFRYGKEKGYKNVVMKANWDKYGKSAGYIRNEQMQNYILSFEKRGCVCFWDGESVGTQHNFDLAKKRNTPLKVYNYKEKKFVKI